jgi:EmrB/QacA subfamily drug resistance transporter
MPEKSRSFVLAAILLSVFLSALEATVVATAMPTAVADLHGIELYGWVGSAYMLATTVTIPLWGKSADVWGRKPAMLAGLVFFLAGSFACGLAGTMFALVLARVVQGVGAGALQPVALTLVGDLFRIEERGRVQGALGAVWAVAGMLGPLVGGLFVRWLSWRWVFYINLPFGLLSGLLLVLFLHEPARAPGPRPRFDLAGATLLAVSVVALLLGLGGQAGPLALPAAAVALLAFVLVERRTREPLVPVALLRDRSIVVACAVVGLLGMVMLGEVVFLPFYVQSARGGTPTEGGLAVAPMLIGWPVASTVAGRLLPKVGPRILVRIGHLLIVLGTAAGLLVVLSGAALPLVGVSMIVLGAGMGLVNTSLVIAVQEGAAPGQRGVATALTVFFRSIGSALGLGALGALLAQRLAGVLDEAALGALLSRDPDPGRPGAALLPPNAAGLVDHALRPLFGVVAAIGVAALFVGLAYPRSPLDPPPAVE